MQKNNNKNNKNNKTILSKQQPLQILFYLFISLRAEN